MTIKLGSIKADLEREKKGDWIPYPEWPGVSFNVSSLNLPAYETARDLLLQRLRAEFKTNTIPSEILIPRLGELYGIHILHGWQGFDQEYTPALALKLLMDAEYRDLVRAIEWCAGEVSKVNIEFLDKDVKNSGKPSVHT